MARRSRPVSSCSRGSGAVAGERVYPAAPLQGGRGLVASPFQYYLSGAENLRVRAWNRANQRRITITGRFWRESDRSIEWFAHSQLIGGTSTTGAAVDYRLDGGALLNLRIAGEPLATGELGDLFVQAQIIIGLGGATQVLGTLLQGYLDDVNELAWPGSPIASMHSGLGRLVYGGYSNGLVPMRLEAQVPDFARWKFVCGNCTFTSSAVVANRAVVLRVLDPTGVTMFIGDNHANQAAGLTIGYNFSAAHTPSSSTSANNKQVPLPPDLELTPNAMVQMLVVNEQVGDAITGGGFVVREWMEP